MNTKTYFKNFFAEKEIPFAAWEIEGADDMTHMIDSEFVVVLIKGTSGAEAQGLANTLMRLDFANAPMLPFLEHLARGYVANI